MKTSLGVGVGTCVSSSRIPLSEPADLPGRMPQSSDSARILGSAGERVSGWDKNPRATAKTATQRKDDRTSRSRSVVGGLFGLGAAIVGALAGVGGGYFIADRQVDAQVDQSQTDFLRNERRIAYGDLLKADAALLAVENEAFSYTEVDILPEVTIAST